MKERLICAVFIIPAYINCFFAPKNKKIEFCLRVISTVFLFLLACYLGVVLPQ